MSASNRLRANLMLLTTALIWGVAFVAQSVGMDYIGPFTFNCVRSLLGGLVLLPCIFLLDRLDGGKTAAQKKWPVLGGVCCGVVLAVASSLQQIGIAHTSVGKAGFITALYIVIVPLLGLLGGKQVGGRIWAAVALAVAGFYSHAMEVKAGKIMPLGVIYIGCVIFVAACSLTGVLLTSDRALFMFFLGGLCFSLSDNMLVVLSFGRNDSPYRNAVLHVLYYMAQIFIALSILFYTP